MTAIHLNPVAVSSVALLRAIRAGGWSNQKELAEAAGRSPKNIARDIGILRGADLLADGDDIALSDIGEAQLDAIDRAESGQGGQGEPGLPGGGRFPWQVGDIRLLRHSEIRPDPDNARRDWDSDDAKDELDALREDIIQVGLLQNLVVRPGVATDGDGEAVYTLVGGERRWRAIGLAIFDDDWPADRPIPCRVVDLDELGHRLTALSENLQRRDLNPLEKARAFDALAKALADQGVEDGKINREIADRVGVTIEHIQQTRRLLDLPEADQERLALPDDDPRRLKVGEARKQLAEAAAAEKALAELTAVPVEERLALIEILHAVSATAHYSYADIPVRADAAQSAVGLALTARRWANFKGLLTYGDHMGHHAVARGHGVPTLFGEPFWTGTPETREAALRAAQAEAGCPDRTDYVTEWLNGPFELTEEGQALIDDHAARVAANLEREAETDRKLAERKAAAEAEAERQRAVAARSRDLFATVRTFPPGQPFWSGEVTQIASQADAQLPWRMRFNGDVVAADGELIIGGRTDDRAEARMRLLILAVNAAGGVETPEDEPDPNPTLTEEGFIAAVAAAFTDHGAALGEEALARRAREVVADFLSDNGVCFGDGGFDWTAEGASTLVVEALADEIADPESQDGSADHEDAA